MQTETGAGAMLGGAIVGAIAAGAAGAIDALWSWSALSQFLPGFASKLRLLIYLAASYALAGAVIGAVLAGLVWMFSRATRLGEWIRAWIAAQTAQRKRAPRDGLAALSLAIAGVVCTAGALAGAYFYGLAQLSQRKHIGLVIASAMGLAVGALIVAALLSFALGRVIELGLGALAGRARIARVLASPRAPVIAAGVLIALGGAVAVIASWNTLSLLNLRPAWVALTALGLALGSFRIGARAAPRWERLRPALRRLAPCVALIVLIGLMLMTGGTEGVLKASRQYSGLGEPIARVARTMTDLDRDGYSSILGGGDCDDLDADVHPGAAEIPDDGIDQNCVGGDVRLGRSTDEVGFAKVPGSVPKQFNVLLITIDTVRADHFGAYGYDRPTTPTMDAIARDGALFVNAWAHAPSTRYSIPAILTGRYPLKVRYDYSIRGWPGLSEDNTTIAEHLKSVGMTTGAILNYWYFDTQRRMNQGFDHYDNQNKKFHKQVAGKGPAETRGSSSRQQTDKALEYLARRAGQRFFLWVHYYDPHYQYEAHPEVPTFGAGNTEIDRYDNEIRFTDFHIARLIDDLKQRGVYDRTVIVITGDHGEGFGEHGIRFHGYHLYAAQTKVPLIIRVPGVAPVTVTMPASHVDILPTLANLAGIEPSSDMLGRSLVDVIAGLADPDQDRYVFQQLSYENNNEMRAAASKQCHVIYNVSPQASWELYRIDRDPDEARDVIDSPGPCGDARRTLEAWYDTSEIPDGAAEALLADKPAIARPLDLELGDTMRLIGVDLPTGAIRPGHSFAVTYTFEARGPLTGGWKVFAHFEGPHNRRFMGDHAPPRPFAWWRAGQYIRYTHTVTVPRGMVAGEYQLWIGLFRKTARIPATSANLDIRDNRANVGAIRVGR